MLENHTKTESLISIYQERERMGRLNASSAAAMVTYIERWFYAN
jgi:hypothetical protein